MPDEEMSDRQDRTSVSGFVVLATAIERDWCGGSGPGGSAIDIDALLQDYPLVYIISRKQRVHDCRVTVACRVV